MSSVDGWRRPLRGLDVVMMDGQPDPATALRGADAAVRLDALLAAAQWCHYSMDPEVGAMALLFEEAADAIRRGVTDTDGRAVSVGRLLGIQPASGLSAAQIIAFGGRNLILREARAAMPEWAAMSHRKAAEAMRSSYLRYIAGGWLVDLKREARPVFAPASFWWRLAKLRPDDPASLMPKVDRLRELIG